MIVPNYSQEKIVNEDGTPTENFSSFMRNMLQNMQLSLSDEGFWVPSVSSDPNSVDPPQTGGQLAIVAASYQGNTVNPDTQTVTAGVQLGTIVFDPYEVNGATPPARNGQLKVFLADLAFHPITNT